MTKRIKCAGADALPSDLAQKSLIAAVVIDR